MSSSLHRIVIRSEEDRTMATGNMRGQT